MKAAMLIAGLLAASMAWAQEPRVVDRPAGDRQAPPVEVDPVAQQMNARYQVAVMERVLEQAVQHGAMVLGRQLQAAAQNVVLFTGSARARGFKLESYGYFFAVDVPMLRQSVSWTLRALGQPDPVIARALQSLRQHVQSLNDPAARAALEQALARVEGQVGPVPSIASSGTPGTGPGGQMRAATVGSDAAPAPPAPDPGWLDNPNERYTEEVKSALVDAMFEYGGSLQLADEEWLTVAARDNEARLAPGELSEGSTLILRIRGRDLAAVRADRLSLDEARKRVDVREF